MSKKSAVWALVIFGSTVALTYLFVPPEITRNPLIGYLLVIVLLISAPLIRERLRKAPNYDRTAETVLSISRRWRPSLWLGVALIVGSIIWLFAALMAIDGSGAAVPIAFVPWIIAFIGGWIILGVRFWIWLMTLIFRED
jgi:flagellar biosynthesis protein FliQ